MDTKLQENLIAGMFPTSNYSLALGKSQPLRTNAECPGLTALNAVLGVSCFYGTAANLVILIFTILKHRHQGLTPDRILITNFAGVDLMACFISLPLHVRAINSQSSIADNPICLSRFLTMFTCFAVNIMTLAVISIDRYDAICRAPLREITCKKTAYFLVFIWLFASCTAAAGGTGHILTAVRGEHACYSPGRDVSSHAIIGKTVMIAVVSLWILPSLAIVFYRFYAIRKYVQDHSTHLRDTLGVSVVKREVKLTKICIVMITTYLSLWVMFALMVLLRNRFSSLEVHCAYLWSYSLAYSSFTVVPVEYMILDKRILAYIWRECARRRRTAKVSVELAATNHEGGETNT